MNFLYRCLIFDCVVSVLAVLLIWKPSFMSRDMHKLIFVLAMAAFLLRLMGPASSVSIDLNSAANRFRFAALVLYGITPFALLMEAGVAGFRGFASWMRYLSISIGIVGVIGIIGSILIPKLMRH